MDALVISFLLAVNSEQLKWDFSDNRLNGTRHKKLTQRKLRSRRYTVSLTHILTESAEFRCRFHIIY